MVGGLANIGNTCSINSLIQCLGHCPSFRKALLDTSTPFRTLKDKQFSLFQELRLILHQLWVDKQSLVPVRFLKAYYESLGDMYQPGEQFDFTEMLLLTINTLLEESHTPSYKLRNKSIYIYDDPMFEYLEQKAYGIWEHLEKSNNSPLADLLHGVQIQQIKCNRCHKTYHNMEPFTCTYLEIAESGTIEQCFSHYYKEEQLKDWKCDHCKHKEAEKLLRFWKLPQIWVIVLKRFDQQNKITKPIHLLPQFGIKTLQGNAHVYELTAIANHYGSLNYGHYNAFCKGEESWTLFDDTDIKKDVNIEKVLQSNLNSYVLFFEKVKST